MFDLQQLIDSQTESPLQLQRQYVNPAFAGVLKILGFDADFVGGRGAYLYDRDGRRYIDGLGGFGVFACGRNHPVIRDAIRQAMEMDLPSLIKMGAPRLSGVLAKQLCELAPGAMERVYFSNSGAEANEAAIKFARAATGRDRILYCHKSYHGLTLGALSVSGADEFREGFGAMLEPATAIPFNDADALRDELAKGDVAGFIVEPIQGKGVYLPDDDYLPAAAELCREHGALMIADEVQTGIGRTGKMFACEHWDVRPDIVTISKALSGGYVPVAATITSARIHTQTFSSLDRCMVHSTTFGQNDLAMTAGLATLHVLREEGLIENAAAMGRRLLDRTRGFVDEFEMVSDVRGKGLIYAIDFSKPKSLKLKMGWNMIHSADKGLFPQAIIMPLLSDHRILSQVAGVQMDVIKLIPPLVLKEEDVDEIADALRVTIGACHQFPGPVWEIAKNLTQHTVRSSS
jgi:acetylornithine/succinyldiaminopimelate/putrescine aminotransferase